MQIEYALPAWTVMLALVGALITGFIPNIWAARFTLRLWDALVWGSRVNTNYEGEIASAGDTVKIPTPTTVVSVQDYMVDTDIAAPGTTQGTTTDLDIDQQKYFHFYVDDIDAAQSRPNVMDDAMRVAARAMAVQMDSFLRAKFQTDGYAAGRLSAAVPGDPAATTDVWGKAFLRAVMKMKQDMTVADIPMEDRWMVVHPKTLQGLENYFLIENPSGVWLQGTQEQMLRNGYAGNLLGFSIHVTRRVLDGSQIGGKDSYRITAGQGNEPVTLATQIVRNEAYRPERRFGDAVKGLMVYGAKTVIPTKLWHIEHQKAA